MGGRRWRICCGGVGSCLLACLIVTARVKVLRALLPDESRWGLEGRGPALGVARRRLRVRHITPFQMEYLGFAFSDLQGKN